MGATHVGSVLFTILWNKTPRKAINLVLSLGKVICLDVDILYYTYLIFNGFHFSYVFFLIFVVGFFRVKIPFPAFIEV
jgi:hypothetical protein